MSRPIGLVLLQPTEHSTLIIARIRKYQTLSLQPEEMIQMTQSHCVS